LIQVSYSISQEETEDREVVALKKAMKELNLSKALILTYDEKKEIITDQGVIEVLPTWHWLLNLL
jgi:uncharacterized protein